MKKYGKMLAALLLCAMMLSGILPGMLPAAKAAPSGDGSADHPYLIESADDLKWFRGKVNGENGAAADPYACAKLMADIDLGGAAWTPIATGQPGYLGTFDGNYHTVSGLNVDETAINHCGFFGIVMTGGTVRNLALNGSVKGAFFVGSVAGRNDGTIENCHCSVALICNSDSFGGIAGVSGNSGMIKNCSYCSVVPRDTADTLAAVSSVSTGTVADDCRRITLKKVIMGFFAVVSFDGTTPQISFSPEHPEYSTLCYLYETADDGRRTDLSVYKPFPVPDNNKTIEVHVYPARILNQPEDLDLEEGYTKAALSINVNGTPGTALYSETTGEAIEHDHAFVWYKSDADGMLIEPLYDETAAEMNIPAGKPAGTEEYYVCMVSFHVRGALAGFQIPSRPAKVTVTAKAAVTVTPPEAKDLTYTGEEQQLITKGQAEGGTVSYAIGVNADTAPDSGWGEAVPRGTDAGTYFVWYKAEPDEHHKGGETGCVTVIIKKATPDAPPAPEADSVNSVSVTLKKTAGYQYCMEGSSWQNSNVFDGLTKDTEYTFYQRIAGDNNHEPSLSSEGTVIRTAAISYSTVKAEGVEQTSGEIRELVVRIQRSENDDETFGNYTGAAMDGKALTEKESSAARGSLILTVFKSYMETLSVGDHTLKVSFTDGTVTIPVKINAAAPTASPSPSPSPEPTASPKPVPKTGDTSDLLLWGGIVILGIIGVIVVMTRFSPRKKKK